MLSVDTTTPSNLSMINSSRFTIREDAKKMKDEAKHRRCSLFVSSLIVAAEKNSRWQNFLLQNAPLKTLAAEAPKLIQISQLGCS